MDKVSKDIEILKTLNLLWEKSINNEKTDEEIESFLNSNMNITKEILQMVIPEYKKLLQKEELTKEEEWELIYIKDILEYLTFTTSMHQSLASAFVNISPRIKSILKDIFDIYIYLSDLTGMYPQVDKGLQEQINQSLKDKEEGKVRLLDEVLEEL